MQGSELGIEGRGFGIQESGLRVYTLHSFTHSRLHGFFHPSLFTPSPFTFVHYTLYPFTSQ
jgi:hypothetical protein